MQSEQPWYIAAELAQLPFPLAAKAWLETRRAYISPKTFHEYEINIKMLSTFFGEMRLPEIDGDQVRAYQRMRQAQCGPFGINHECGLLCQIRKRINIPLKDYQAFLAFAQEETWASVGA